MIKISQASHPEWLASSTSKSVAIVCTDGYGDVEMAKAIKSHGSCVRLHLFEPGNFLPEDAAEFDLVLFGFDTSHEVLSTLKSGEFLLLDNRK